MDKNIETKVCSICGREYIGWGNNAQPINDGRCCDLCNSMYVIPARLGLPVELPKRRKPRAKAIA